MAKQIDNQNTGVKPSPGDMQAAANKPASAPTYTPPNHKVGQSSGRADRPERGPEFDTSKK